MVVAGVAEQEEVRRRRRRRRRRRWERWCSDRLYAAPITDREPPPLWLAVPGPP